jgi:hypothetical protein
MRSILSLALGAISLTFLGYGLQKPTVAQLPEAVPLVRAGISTSPPFGGSYPGQSYWLSRNSRYALIYQWREDTNGDGKVSISIGYHGDMVEDEPHPYLIDLQSGTTTRYDEFIDASAGRWLALREGQTTWLVDTETGTRTALTDDTDLVATDDNECAGPRGLVFDGSRARLGIIVDEPNRFTVHDLIGNSKRIIESGDDVLWRARFTAADDVVVFYLIPADSARADTTGGLPRQKTTCSTRFGAMFAASFSFQGWEGPPYYPAIVAPDGSRLRLEDEPLVLSPDLIALGDTALIRMDGKRVALPEHCGKFRSAPGSHVVILECGQETRLFDPLRGQITPLTRTIIPVRHAHAIRDRRGQSWLPVLATDTANEPSPSVRLGRLRIEDGHLEVGPVVTADVQAVGDGWAHGRHDDTLHMIDIATGRHATVGLQGQVRHLGFPGVQQDPGPFLLLDPEGGRYLEVEEHRTRNDRGCYLVASGEYTQGLVLNTLEQGPWRLRCAAG